MIPHRLKSSSSRIVVILKSLRHGGCVRCGKKIASLEESEKHWDEEIDRTNLDDKQRGGKDVIK